MESLEKEYRELLDIKSKLIQEIDEINEMEEFAMARTTIAYRRFSFFRRLPLEWTESVFITRRDILKNYITGTFENGNIRAIITKFKTINQPYEDHYFALLCTDVDNTSEGIVLTLQDPYRIIKTYPMTEIDHETAIKWKGYILIAKLRITKDSLLKNEFLVCNIQELNLTRNGCKEGEVQYIFNSKIYEASKIFLQARTKEQCRQVLDNAEKYFLRCGWYIQREDLDVLTVQKEDCKFALFTGKEGLICIIDNAKPLTKVEKNFISTNTLNEIFNITLSSEYRRLLDPDY